MEASAGHLELALMYAQLHTFEREFYDVAGHLYVRLDEARAKVATARARLNPGTNREAVAAAAARFHQLLQSRLITFPAPIIASTATGKKMNPE